MNNQPLKGFRILDVTNVLSGPFCGYQLGLLGAEIIKIEAPDGDLARQLGANPSWNEKRMGISFLAQNAGKRSISLNLKSEAGQQIFLELVKTSDALIENFRPGVMDRLGLGFEVCKATKDPIVYCAISGFGQQGPLKDNPAYDQIIQGMSGVMDITGSDNTPPYRVGYPIADTVGGLTAALAVSAALHQKKSQYIDVSMLESVLTTMGWAVSNLLMHQVEPTRVGNENMTSAPSGTFQTRDGLINIAANQDRQWEQLVAVLHAPALKEDIRYQSREHRKANRHALKADLEAILSRRSTDEWMTEFQAANIPAGPVLSVREALELEQIQMRGFTQKIQQDHPSDTIDVVTNGFLLNGERLKAESPVETLGESTASILGELGYDSLRIDSLKNEGVIG
ncbi:CoA transferase [Litorivicinus sp.]|nr:CoA transferase [Litorivicinus sp.]